MRRESAFAAWAVVLSASIAPGGGPPRGGDIIGRIPDPEPNNNTSAGAAIVYIPVPLCAGAIAGECALTPGDVDHFSIFPSVGSRIAVMTVPLGALPHSFEGPDTIVELLIGAAHADLAGGPSVVASNNDGGDDFPQHGAGVRGSAVQHLAAFTGPHTLRVSLAPGAAGGRYQLIVATMPACVFWEEATNDTPAAADELALQNGPLIVAANSAPGIANYFSVAMETGDVLYAMTVPKTTGLEVADTILAVIDSDGVTVLAENDDADPVDRGSAIRFRAPAPGTYYLRETHFQTSAAGSYALVAHLRKAPHCSGDSDGDGEIDFADITEILKNFNTHCP
jgi:hypothetical protein